MISGQHTTGIRSDLGLLALHGLRLKGFAPSSTVAAFYGLDEAELDRHYRRLADEGLVKARHDGSGHWLLTPAGRAEGERRLAAELDRTAQRGAVIAAYRAFRALDGELKAVCVRWQVIDVETRQLNDHTDRAYDDAVIAALADLDRRARPVLASLRTALARYAPFDVGLATALAEVTAGHYRWFADPIVASYHTLWFELHEDLLATLGLDRAAEAGAPVDGG